MYLPCIVAEYERLTKDGCKPDSLFLSVFDSLALGPELAVMIRNKKHPMKDIDIIFHGGLSKGEFALGCKKELRDVATD